MSDASAGESPKRENAPVSETTVEPPPKEFQSAMKKLSESKPQAMFEMMSFAGAMGNPLHNKMDSQHITQVLELAVKHDEREFEIVKTKEANNASEKVSTRRYVFATFITIIALVIFILCVFRNQPQILVPILSGIGGMVGGFLAGMGVGKQQGK